MSVAENYLHGYLGEEQERLLMQAEFLEDLVFEAVDFSQAKHIIEVGCGVGAQTRILLRRFPQLKVSGLDAEPKQVERAKSHGLARADFTVGFADKLPFADASFDGAFICWFLEHLRDPGAALRELARVLKPGAKVFLNEVFNPLFHIEPRPEATVKYWKAFNDAQAELGGDPLVGLRLGNLLTRAGFRVETQRMLTRTYDSRDLKARNEKLDYWYDILWSARPQLEKAGKVDSALIALAKTELAHLKENPDAIFHFGFTKAIAIRP